MIYLFDKDEKLIKIVRKSAIKTALQKYALTTERYVSDRLTVEMKGLNDDELEKVEYMAIQTIEDAHTFHYFYVAQKSTEQLTTLIGVQSGIEELRKIPVFDKRPKDAFAREVINDLLAGSNWQARFIGEDVPRSTNFYYISVFDALKKVCEVWDLEMQFFVEMHGNQIGARYIDFKHRLGQAVGKRVVYGHNALEILQEVERTNIFTALVGRGKGEQVSSAEESGNETDGYGRKITFEDVVWSIAEGKPLNKPKGQKYLELPSMTKQYGIKQIDGSMRPKIGFVEFSEEEDPEVLLERTYKALIDTSRPQLTLKTSTVYLKGVKIGDTIRVVRHDKKLDYDTRIFEITFNRLNNQSSDIKLGDRVGESNEAKAQAIADKAIEDFVANEFTNFVQNLPDHLPNADGFNNNWYGTEDPTLKNRGKVLINDIWFKPDPEHEGHKIMLRWTGEVWEEILRTYDSEALRGRIAEEVAKVKETMESNDAEHQKQIDSLLKKAGVSQSLAEEAKGASDQAKREAADALSKALQYKNEAVSEATRLLTAEREATASDLANAKKQAVEEATQLVDEAKSLFGGQISDVNQFINHAKKTFATTSFVNNSIRIFSSNVGNTIGLKANQTEVDVLAGRIKTAETSITQQAEQIALKANRSDVDVVNSRLQKAESSLTVQANEIASRVKTSDFDQAKQRLATAESSISQLGNRITTEISGTVAKIPRSAGSRNYLKNSKLLNFTINSNSIQDIRMFIIDDFWTNERRFRKNMVRLSFDIAFTPALPKDIQTNVHFSATPWYNSGGITFKGNTTDPQHFDLLFDLSNASKNYRTDNVFIRFDNTFPLSTKVNIERMTLYLSELTELWTQATEDLEDGIDTVKTIITQTAEGQQQLSKKLTETSNKVITAETNIKQLINDVSSKVSQVDFDTVKKTVQNNSTTIAQNQNAIKLKAEKSYVDGVKSVADSAKSTAANALTKASANTELIRTTQAELQVTSDAIETKVSQTDFDATTKRLATAETAITTQAGLIEQRLTSSQVESVIADKGYQTKADVDKNITGRGYITENALQPYVTSTILENKVKETSDSFSRSITETKALIPSDFGGGNLIKNGAFPSVPWPGSKVSRHAFYFNQQKNLLLLETSSPGEVIARSNRFELKRNTKYSLSFYAFAGGNVKSSDVYVLGRKVGETADFTVVNRIISERRFSNSKVEYVTVTFNSGEVDNAYLRFDNNGSSNGNVALMYFGEVMLVEGNTPRKWEACVDDLVTETKYNEVKDTVDSHTRTIGEQGKTISQVIQTAQGLVTRVNDLKNNDDAVKAMSTQVSQLAGSWAVQNLTNSGTILNQLNLNKDGSIKIDGKLIQITGTTYIQDGVITSAKLGDVDAGKIKTGTLDAANVNIINLNANKVVGLDGNFIRSKIEFAMIEWMRGKTISAKNDAMRINLNNANISFNRDATIDFNSANNALVRRKGTHTAFVHFNDVSKESDNGVGSLYAAIGVTSSGDGINSQSSGRFSGIRVFRGAKGLENLATVDQLELYGDSIMFRHAFGNGAGLDINPAYFDGHYNMNELIGCIKFLVRVYTHLSNVGGNWKNRDFINTFVDEFNHYNVAGVLGTPMPNGNTFNFG